MATFVLHANTPCAGKGNVSTLSGPNHSIAVSVAGVGAVFAQFQVWGREDGGEPGKINGLVTVSGTTSATQTVTFTGRYKEIWLELVGISAASTFSATITTLETEFATKAELDAAVAANGGQSLGPSVSVAGVLWVWDAGLSAYRRAYAGYTAPRVGILGDSLAALNGGYLDRVAYLMGWRIVYDGAQGGTKILDQLTKIPALVASGANTCLLHVGTNNADTQSATMYADFVTLFDTLISNGIEVYAFVVGTKTPTSCANIYKGNIALWRAATKCGVRLFDAFTPMALAAGSWSVPLMPGDSGTHPVESAHFTAGTLAASLIKDGVSAFPRVRTSFDGMLANPCFTTDTNADGMSDSWVANTVGSNSTYSREADGSNGHYYQIAKITNPTSGNKAEISQDVTTGFSPGDKILFHMEASLSCPDGADGKLYWYAYIEFRTAGNAFISTVYPNGKAYNANGDTYTSGEYTVPANCGIIRVVAGWTCWTTGAVTGEYVAKATRAGLVNLSAIGAQ